jgi:hypothetical protein
MVPMAPVERPGYEAMLAAARRALDEPAFAAAWAGGQALSREQIGRLALDGPDASQGAADGREAPGHEPPH